MLGSESPRRRLLAFARGALSVTPRPRPRRRLPSPRGSAAAPSTVGMPAFIALRVARVDRQRLRGLRRAAARTAAERHRPIAAVVSPRAPASFAARRPAARRRGRVRARRGDCGAGRPGARRPGRLRLRLGCGFGKVSTNSGCVPCSSARRPASRPLRCRQGERRRRCGRRGAARRGRPRRALRCAPPRSPRPPRPSRGSRGSRPSRVSRAFTRLPRVTRLACLARLASLRRVPRFADSGLDAPSPPRSPRRPRPWASLPSAARSA